MNISYFINYGIFSAFILLFLLEVGVGLLSLISFGNYREKLMRYIVPVWEINGTFGVFYVVNLEATYPSAVPLVGTIYVIPVILAITAFMAHNGYIAYAEYIGKPSQEALYMRIYGFSMLLVAFIAISMLTSSVSGISIDLKDGSINLVMMFANYFNILYFAGITLMTVSVSMIFFEMKKPSKVLPIVFLLAAVALIAVATLLYTPYIFANFLQYLLYFVVVLAILLVSYILYLKDYGIASKVMVVLGTYSAVMYYGLLEYPYFFNGQVNAIELMNSSVMTEYINAITIIGGVLAAAFITVFVYFSYFKNASDEDYANPENTVMQ